MRHGSSYGYGGWWHAVALLALLRQVAAAVMQESHWEIMDTLKNRWKSPELSGGGISEDCDTWVTTIVTDGKKSSTPWVSCNSQGYVYELILTNIDLKGTLPDEIGNLTTLQSLTLVGTNLFGTIPSWIVNLSSLQSLILGSNDMEGSIPEGVGSSHPLRELDLSYNSLTGRIPESLFQASSLSTLTLSDNALSGVVSPSIGNLKNLKTLNLDRNYFSGSIPPEIGSLLELKDLHFSENLLSGSIPETLKNCQNLEDLNLYDNDLEGQIPEIFYFLNKLERLKLSSNYFVGTFPASLTNASSLIVLDLGNNSISGPLPEDIGNLKNLNFLDISNNKLNGTLPKSFTALEKLERLLGKKNNFIGGLPEDIEKLTNLMILDLRYIGLNGSLPPGIVNNSYLKVLDLEQNNFSGTLPEGFAKMQKLEKINLSYNRLRGPILASFFNSVIIKLDLSSNFFEGELPTNLSSTLIFLNLSNNSFWGPLKPMIGPNNNTESVLLSRNQLSGDVTSLNASHWPNLSLLDLQHNNLSSASPLSLPPDTIVEFGNNPLCTPRLISSSSFFNNSCLSSTYITSYTATPICPFSNCSKLFEGLKPSPRIFNLTGNCVCMKPFYGTFVFYSPSFVMVTDRIVQKLEKAIAEVLKLYNTQVRVETTSMASDKVWTVHATFFPNFTESWPPSKIDNIVILLTNPGMLLGRYYGGYSFISEGFFENLPPPLPPLLPSPPTPEPKTTKTTKPKGVWLPVGISIGFFLLIGVASFLILILVRKNKSLSLIESGKEFSRQMTKNFANGIPLSEILEATNNFCKENVLGEGGFGVVYKGVGKNGVSWAVKRAKKKTARALEFFRREVEALSKMSHQNLVQLLGFCDEEEERILVYEFADNGTLREHLYHSLTEREPLSFEERVEIAVGAAHGLHYLHSFAKPAIVHRDIKTDNILLDRGMQAKIADFGLLKDIPNLSENDEEGFHTKVAGTMGYLDPEYFANFKVTTKSDVYGFGVVMMELLSGKPPVLDVKGHGVSDTITLVEWMDPYITSRKLDFCLDPFLKTYSREAAIMFADLARLCTLPTGKQRPNMEQVSWKLLEIRTLLKSVDKSLLDKSKSSRKR